MSVYTSPYCTVLLAGLKWSPSFFFRVRPDEKLRSETGVKWSSQPVFEQLPAAVHASMPAHRTTMSLAAAVPYVLAYEDQMQSAASSRVPAHAQIGQHQQNRGVSWVLACHGCWQASLSCQQRRWVIASSRVQCLPAPTFETRKMCPWVLACWHAWVLAIEL